MTETFHTMVNFLGKGGLFMWPLLFCSIVTVATIVMAAQVVTSRHIWSRASAGTRWSQNLRTLATARSDTRALRVTMRPP